MFVCEITNKMSSKYWKQRNLKIKMSYIQVRDTCNSFTRDWPCFQHTKTDTSFSRKKNTQLSFEKKYCITQTSNFNINTFIPRLKFWFLLFFSLARLIICTTSFSEMMDSKSWKYILMLFNCFFIMKIILVVIKKFIVLEMTFMESVRTNVTITNWCKMYLIHI